MSQAFLAVFFLTSAAPRAAAQTQDALGEHPLIAAAPKKGAKTAKKPKDRNAEETSGPADNGVEPGSSADNRRHTKFFAAGEIGLVDVLNGGKGVQGGYYLSPNMVAELSYLTSEFSFLIFKRQIDFITGRVKFFFGNSFYLNGGLGIRTTTATSTQFKVFSGSVSGDVESTMSSTQLILEFGLGNRWQMGSGFIIGCDWVGYTMPITELSNSEKISSNARQEDKEDIRDDFKTSTSSGNTNLVRFYLGWAF